MSSVLLKKSWRDLSRRRTRTIFTIATVALGVLGLGLFAVTPMADDQVEKYMREENIHNVAIEVSDVDLNATQVSDVRSIENVKGFEPRIAVHGKMYIGERRNWALFIGIEDMEDQAVDKIDLLSGSLPSDGQVLSDQMNRENDVFFGGIGDSFKVIDHRGMNQTLSISGIGKSLTSLGTTMDGVAVFYTNGRTVRSLANMTGFNSLLFKLYRTDQGSLERTVEDIRSYLTNNTDVVAFGGLPEVRPEGYYEGSESLDMYQTFLSILTFLILFCSIFLISNTMNTMVSEQRKEIAQMKAIGGSRSKIFRSYLFTSFLIGSIGSSIGVLLGIVTAFLVLVQIGKPFGFHPSFSVHPPTVLMSLVIGMAVVVLASIPALVRSARTPILEGLGGHGISSGAGPRGLDKALRAIGALPRTIQMGLRNANRRMGRSIATVFQIALAVSILLAMLSVGSSVYTTVEGNWKDQTWDLKVAIYPPDGGALSEAQGTELMVSVPGITGREPFLNSFGAINGNAAEIYGMVRNTTSLDYSKTLLKKGEGRWWTPEEEEGSEPVMVIGYALARSSGVKVDETVELMTATGPHMVKVIGIDRTSWDNGINIRIPITTLRSILRSDGAISGFYVKASDVEPASIDRLTERIYDMIEPKGYSVNVEVHYVKEAEDRSANQGLMNLFLAVSVIVVLISLIGLMSTLTMNILDRTKEIGILRCIGAGSSEVRAVFGSEGLFLSLIGWSIGVPLGLVIYGLLMAVIEDQMSLSLPWSFPPIYILLSLFVTVSGTLLIILPPLVRATRFRPGEALRYE